MSIHVKGTVEVKESEATRDNNRYIVERYDDIGYRPFLLDFFGDSDFLNFGYWEEHITEQKQACERLVEKLLERIPHHGGLILDVGCGKGATTRHLLQYYRPEQITAINISEKQLRTAKANAPGCRFLHMDATRLHFDDNSFNNIICVEAAFHFCTREDFLKEAWRVLRKDGRVVLSDILMTRDGERETKSRTEQNYVADLDEYRSVFERAGFSEVCIVDATHPCWIGHFWAVVRSLHQALLDRKITDSDLPALIKETYRRARHIRFYVLASARKA
jgi:ubiquinone/menaquinone biosynthesis C-methylase UbiE